MKHYLYLSLVACLTYTVPSHAQENDKKEKPPKEKKPEVVPDSNFIARYPEVFTVGLFTASPLMQMTIKPIDNDLDKYRSEFRGNFTDLVGFSLSYKKLSFSLGFKTPFGTPNDETKGRTVSTGINLMFRKPKYNIAAEYRQLTGYYDNNTPNYVPHTDSLLVRPDVRYKNIGVNGIYNFSWRKYSLNAPLTYHDRQLKSRIGLLLKAGVNYTTISSSDSSLLSSVQTNQFTSFDDVRAINAILAKAGPGIGITIVLFKRIYFAANGFIMGNFINYTYQIEGSSERDWSTNANIYTETNIGFGYNSKRLFVGFSANGDLNIMRIRDASIRTYFATTLITAGYRFDPPKVLTKWYKKAPIIGK